MLANSEFTNPPKVEVQWANPVIFMQVSIEIAGLGGQSSMLRQPNVAVTCPDRYQSRLAIAKFSPAPPKPRF